MSKIREFDGNEFVEMTIKENEIDENEINNIFSFIENHENIFLFGKGLCGIGFKEYLNVCEVDNIRGFVTSETFNELLSDYKEEKDGIILSLKGEYYAEILPLILEKIKVSDILFLKERTKQIFTQTFSHEYFNDNLWLTLPLALHCNINCASCNTFSPLCSPEFYTLESIKKDIRKIKSMNLSLKKINISGGEPFLNPELVEILSFIRELYPSIKIEVYSNGILAFNYSEEKLQALKASKVELHITEYGISIAKLQRLYERLDELDISYMINYTDEKKTFFKKIIDFEKQVPVYEYINCQYYTFVFGLFMYKGRLYKCPMALNTENINRYSAKKLELTDKDYLDLECVDSPDQIYDFWRSRLPMCGYCPRVREVITWRHSDRKIEEWT